MEDYVSYGQLTSLQYTALREFVEGKAVIDLGCGDGELTIALAALGASRVIAVDRDLPQNLPEDEKIEWVESYFDCYDGEVPEVAFLSWPVNRNDFGMIALLRQAETIVYLGKNTGGSACGNPFLFTEFASRVVLFHYPSRPNTLTVYGKPLEAVSRRLTGEEVAVLKCPGRILDFEEAEWAAKDFSVESQLLPPEDLRTGDVHEIRERFLEKPGTFIPHVPILCELAAEALEKRENGS